MLLRQDQLRCNTEVFEKGITIVYYSKDHDQSLTQMSSIVNYNEKILIHPNNSSHYDLMTRKRKIF